MERPGCQRGRGFSLVEVLVAAAIMSTGLAGLAALLMGALSGTTRAADRAAAAMLADSMVSRVHIVPSAVDTLVAGATRADLECNALTPCGAEEFAAASLADWQQALAAQLPAGQGLVCLDGTPLDGTPTAPACDGGERVVVKVFWSRYPDAGYKRLARLAR